MTADHCRANGWNAGTRLCNGFETILVTAVGERGVFAKRILPNVWHEFDWDLRRSDWVEASQ